MRRIGAGLIALSMLANAAHADDAKPAATAAAFKTWVREFRSTAVASGVSPELYDKLTANLAPNFRLPDLDLPNQGQPPPDQPEFIKTPVDYLLEKHMANLVTQGRALLKQHDKALDFAEKTYGVDRAVLLALWGRETAFGTYKLPYNALEVLAVEAYLGKRKELFQKQFLLALKMVQDGAIAPENMKSSWAGAMGLIQFLPSDYYDYGVDADGDGKRDIWRSVPDAMASLAKNLNGIGWKAGQPWGLEARVPATLACSQANLDVKKPVSEWVKLGLAPIEGGSFPPQVRGLDASLLMPAGTFGPAFLTFDNFQVVREYNRSDLYALFVSHLADRIRGGGPFKGAWQPIEQIATADVEDMQTRLTALGFYKDKVDGKAGGRTRSAVGLYQQQAGLAVTCWPSADVLAKLKSAKQP